MSDIERIATDINGKVTHIEDLAILKADIARGLTDLAQGRVHEFDAQRIIERGKTRHREVGFL